MSALGKRHLLVAILVGVVGVSARGETPSTRAIGPVTARVRVDVYSDFQCPYCKVLEEGTMTRVREAYALKGKIRLVHHDFPLPMHQFARQAALYAAAADRIGKFDQVSEALFREQESWGASGKIEDVLGRILTAEDVGRIRQLAKDPSVATVVDRDVEQGRRLDVTSTPTIIVSDGVKPYRVVGSVSYAVFSRFLDQLLGQ
jgi:protein-disulfide isomerase